jgi:hypothetical protein
VGADKWQKHREKWPGNEKRRERSLSAFWRLVLGLVFPQKNKKLPEPVATRFRFYRAGNLAI